MKVLRKKQLSSENETSIRHIFSCRCEKLSGILGTQSKGSPIYNWHSLQRCYIFKPLRKVKLSVNYWKYLSFSINDTSFNHFLQYADDELKDRVVLFHGTQSNDSQFMQNLYLFFHVINRLTKWRGRGDKAYIAMKVKGFNQIARIGFYSFPLSKKQIKLNAISFQ